MPHAFTPPMRVAEKVATVDILSGGRVEWGTGRSTPMEQIAFGVDRDASREQWQEAIETVVGMWESEYFEYHGKYLDFPQRMVTPKPVQDPHPPCWMAATSDGSAAVAGEPGPRPAVVLDHAAAREDGEAHRAVPRCRGRTPTPITRVTTNKVAAYTLVHCADDDGAGRGQRRSGTRCGGGTRTSPSSRSSGSSRTSRQEEKDKIFPLLKMQKPTATSTRKIFNDADMIIVGDPEQCLEKMLKYDGARRRPAASATCSSATCRTSRSCAPSSSSARRSSPSSTSATADERQGRAAPAPDAPTTSRARRHDRLTRTDDTDVPDYPGLLRLDGRGFVVVGAGPGHRPAGHPRPGLGRRARRSASTRTPTSRPTSPTRSAASPGPATRRERGDVERLFADAESRAGSHRRSRRHRRHGPYAALVDTRRRELGLALRHRAAPRLPGDAARRPSAMVANGGGSMVFVASVSRHHAAPLHAAYGAAKAGLMSLVRSAAVELGPAGVRVNAVAPGVVWTPRVSAYLGDDGAGAQQRERAAAPGGRSRRTSRRRCSSSRPTCRRLRDRPDAGRRRRRRRQVPVPDGAS